MRSGREIPGMGLRLKRIAEEKMRETGLKQTAMAREAGISEGCFNLIANGLKSSYDSDTIVKLCRYFNVSADWLLGLTEDQRGCGESV